MTRQEQVDFKNYQNFTMDHKTAPPMSGEQKTAEEGKIRLGDLLLNAGFEIVNRDKEIAALKEALKELIPIASKARGIEFPGEEFQKAVKAIDSAKKLLNKQPQSESDGDKNL